MKKRFWKIIGNLLLVTAICYSAYFMFAPHKVTYDLNGGKAPKSSLVESIRWINNVKVPKAKKNHYKLVGWYDDDNNKVSSLTHESKDVHLTAKWKPKKYSVTFKDDDNVIFESSYKYGDEINLSDLYEPDFSNHPYETFEGWKDSDGNLAEKIIVSDFGRKEYTASFVGNTYNISYDMKGGTAEMPTTYRYGEGIASLPDASLHGYIFNGWFSDEACTNPVTTISSDEHEDVTLHASYTMDTSSGCEIPSIGYRVDYVYDDAFDFSINQYHCDLENAGVTILSGNLTDDNPAYSLVIWYFDHAYQGLRELPYRINAGDKFYLNGIEYTYNGNYIIAPHDDVETVMSQMPSNTRVILQTCVGDGNNYYVYFQ